MWRLPTSAEAYRLTDEVATVYGRLWAGQIHKKACSVFADKKAELVEVK